MLDKCIHTSRVICLHAEVSTPSQGKAMVVVVLAQVVLIYLFKGQSAQTGLLSIGVF